MITLSFLKLLENAGFGTIDTDLFFQKLTLDKTGVYVADIGNPVPQGSRDQQSFELYARGSNDVDGYRKLRDIRKYLIDNGRSICELPAVPHPTQNINITDGYNNVTILKPSTITNVGLDDKNRIIYVMTGTIIYKEN